MSKNDNFSSLFKLTFGENWMPVKLWRDVYSKEHISIFFYYTLHELLVYVIKKSIKSAQTDHFKNKSKQFDKSVLFV